MLPTFLVIGAMKSGTTSMYWYLRAHPDVYMPEVKELNYFTKNWELGQAWYEGQFEQAGDVKAIGEASTNYTKYPQFPGVPERIAALLPDAQLVYVLRNPIDRVRSAYVNAIITGNETRPIEQAVVERPHFVDASRYAMQIDRYMEYFSREQLLILISEDLRRARDQAMQRVFRFIGVDDEWRHPGLDHEYHQTTHKARQPRALLAAARRLPGYQAATATSRQRYPALWQRTRNLMTRKVVEEEVMSPQVRSLLEDMLRDDVRRLRMYLGADFDGWGIA